VGRNFTLSTGAGVNSETYLRGAVGGSAVFNYVGGEGTFNTLYHTGSVGKTLAVTDGAGDLGVFVGYDFGFGPPEAGRVGGGIVVAAGGGTNAFTFDGAVGSTAGGPVVYSGGSGADTVTITGADNRFDLLVFAGGGDDAVAFAPDARVRSALVVFGPGGTRTWTPPAVIDFPLTLIGY
jgi:hypothetical protein